MEEEDQPELWFVVDPIGHRRIARESAPPDGSEIDTPFGRAFVVNTMSMIPDDLWVCDFCNEDVPLYGPTGELQFVAMFESNGICPACVTKNGGIGRWVDAQKLCACEACLIRAAALISQIEREVVNDPAWLRAGSRSNGADEERTRSSEVDGEVPDSARDS